MLKNCNANQKYMIMYEQMRKKIVTWLVDVSWVTEVDECSLFKAVKLMYL